LIAGGLPKKPANGSIIKTNRRLKTSTRLDDFVVMSSRGHRDSDHSVTSNATLNSGDTDDGAEFWRKHMFLSVVDSLIGELLRRFVGRVSYSG